MEPTSIDAGEFTAVYREYASRIFAYARRHSDDTTAQDVVSETFLIAWRRRSELPPSPLPWLLVVARNTLANRRRREMHQDRIADAVTRLDVVAASGADLDVVERQTALSALAQLSGPEREAVLLVAWDGLSNAGAACVSGCSQRAFEVRLSRARARLRRILSVPTGGISRPPLAREATS